jgi:cell division protein ZapA
MGNPVELRVGGQSYRVVASADEADLRRLAGVVDARLRSIQSNRQVSPQALVLAAIALAHDLEEERALRRQAEERSKQMLRALLQRIDAVLDEPPAQAAAEFDAGQLSSEPAQPIQPVP